MSLSRVLTSVLSYLPNSSLEDTSFESQGDVSHMHAILHQNAPKQSPFKELKNKTNSIVLPLRSCWKREVYTLITIKLSLPVNITSFPKKRSLKRKWFFRRRESPEEEGLLGPSSLRIRSGVGAAFLASSRVILLLLVGDSAFSSTDEMGLSVLTLVHSASEQSQRHGNPFALDE